MKLIISLLLGVIPLVAAYRDCTEDSVKECLGDMLTVAQKSQEGQLPSYTPAEFKMVCSEFAKSRTCLKEIRAMCSTQERSELDSVHAMFDYLCGDGFYLYVNNSACMFEPSLETAMEACIQGYTAKSQKLMYGRSSAQEKLRQLCRYTNEYVGCNGHATKKKCGASAAKLIVESAKRIFNVVFENSNFQCVISAATGVAVSFVTILASAFVALRYSL